MPELVFYRSNVADTTVAKIGGQEASAADTTAADTIAHRTGG